VSAQLGERATVTPRFTADVALRGLRFRGLSYRPDVRRPEGLWTAECPRCQSYGFDGMPLTIREARPGGAVTVQCRNRCPSESIMVNLAAATQPTTIEARVRRLELLTLGRGPA
jgi:hypothetical protein